VKFLPKLFPSAADGLAMNVVGLPDLGIAAVSARSTAAITAGLFQLGGQLDHVRLESRTVGVTIIHLRRLRTPPAARTMPS
jgi:hypothetical protein